MTQATVTQATRADIPVLLELIGEFYAHEDIPYDPVAAATALRNLLADESLGQVWLMQYGGRPVGYMVITYSYSLEYHGRAILIDEFYLQESHRGLGIGSQALTLIESIARSHDAKVIHLEVEQDNERAQKFYIARGFHFRRRFLTMNKQLE